MTTRGMLSALAGVAAGSALSRGFSDSVPIDALRARLGGMTMEQGARRGPREDRQPPRMAVTLDDKKVDPRDIAHHPFPQLIYVVTPETMKDETLRVYISADAAMEYIKDIQVRYGAAEKPSEKRALRSPFAQGATSQSLTQGYYGAVGGYVTLHEHVDYGGAAWTFWADWGTIRDFRSVFCFLWWCQSIDDQVSSVDVNINYIDPAIPHMPYVVLFSSPNLSGAQLWLWSGSAPGGPGLYPDLRVYGWNDVASSMRYF